MGVHFRRCLLAVFALALIGARTAAAQTGTITGRVTDAASGGALPGAQIRALGAAGGASARTLSDANGQFRMADLQPGTYTLLVELLGFEARRIEGVRVVAGQTTMQAITLTPVAFELNPVVVSASKRQEKVIDAPASVAVVDSRAVASRPATSPVDHLRSAPGVDIVTQGVQAANVVVRGFNNIFSGSLHALTDNRIAGVPSLRVNLLHLNPSTDDDIDRMEIVLGPGSALYGPNTADGVLHIITKSPLDQQGTSVAIGGGTRSLMNASFRTSQLLTPNLGIKVSGQYLQAEEWAYVDEVEQAEKFKFQSNPFFKQDLMRATGIDSEEADRRIARIGNRDFDIQRWSADLRADWRVSDGVTAILAGGMTHAGNSIELTGLGAAQAIDWNYSYVQGRLLAGRLFAQAYANFSDVGDTYLLRNGAPISDRSRMYVAQVQHGFALGTRQNFTYGLDYIRTNPITDRTINGGYEDDDETTEFGAYLQSETAITNWMNLVLAGRVDTHSALPDAIFSPRAGLVFKPAETQAFRITYNRAFSTPSSINQFLDLGSAIPDVNAARLGYSLRIQGTGADGFRFRQPDGTYLMRSPFTPAPAQLVAANAAAYWAAAVGVLQQMGAIDAATANYLAALQPAAAAAISSNFFNPSTGAVGPLSALDLDKIDPIRESTTTTFEVGYKGVLGDRFVLAADLWYSKRENLVTPLTIATPFITLNPQETIAFLTQRFMADFSMPQAQAQAQAAMLTCGATDGTCPGGLATIPLGVISSGDVNANGAQLLTTYFNVEDELDLYGLDLAATALLSDSWSLGGTLSLVNEDVFETKRGETVTLNAPKTKGSLALAYRGAESGIDAEIRGRYNEGYPVRSGVYNGTLCIGGTEPGAERCVDSYTLVDLTLGYRLPMFRGVSLQASIQNVFDEDYRSFPGVPEIGRTVLFRLKYDF